MTPPNATSAKTDVPLKDEKPKDTGRKLAVGLALLLFGVGGGAGIRRFLYRAPGAPGAAPAGRSPFQGEGLSGNAASLWGRLLGVLGMGARGFGFDRLATLLFGHEEPVAMAFSADFRKETELVGIWDEFRTRHAEKDIDASWFARRLSESQAFSRLMNRYAADPKFVGVANAVTREVSSAVLNSGAAGVKNAKGMAPGGNFALAGGPDGAPTGPSAPSQGPGEGGFNTGPLKAVEAVTNTTALPGFESLFSKSTMERSQKEQIIASLVGGNTITGACQNAQATAQCMDAYSKCQADPDCSRSLSPAVSSDFAKAVKQQAKAGGGPAKGPTVIKFKSPDAVAPVVVAGPDPAVGKLPPAQDPGPAVSGGDPGGNGGVDAGGGSLGGPAEIRTGGEGKNAQAYSHADGGNGKNVGAVNTAIKTAPVSTRLVEPPSPKSRRP